MNGQTGLNYDLKDIDVIRSMLDFGLVLYGKCTSKMDDNDPRIEISAVQS
jgi:hypothetical protein